MYALLLFWKRKEELLTLKNVEQSQAKLTFWLIVATFQIKGRRTSNR